MTLSLGDRVSYRGRVWFVRTISPHGWGDYALLNLIDPDTMERCENVLSSHCEPIGLRVIDGGPWPRLVCSNGERIGA